MNLINNQAYLLIKALSYNLLNWFWLALFTEEDSHFEVSTIRRKILNVPGNLVGSRTYRHLKLAPNQELEARVNYMEKQLQIFLVWYIATMEEWSPELAAEAQFLTIATESMLFASTLRQLKKQLTQQ